jgi:hypothetical protein
MKKINVTMKSVKIRICAVSYPCTNNNFQKLKANIHYKIYAVFHHKNFDLSNIID